MRRAPVRPAPEAMIRSLNPAQRQALLWLPGSVQEARLAACDQTRRAPRANTMAALRKRGLAHAVTWTGWWRVTCYGLEVRQHMASPCPPGSIAT